MSARRRRAAYLEAAWEILAAEGAEGLTQAALCDRLHVTTGAFYHHFGSMAEFIGEVAAFREAYYRDLMGTVTAEPEALRRLELLARAAFGMAHRSEAAYRAWATSNERVAASVGRIDDLVRGVFADALSEIVGDRDRAVMLSHMGMSIVVGMVQRGLSSNTELFAAVGLEFYRASLGLDAEAIESGGEPTLRLRRPAAAGPVSRPGG